MPILYIVFLVVLFFAALLVVFYFKTTKIQSLQRQIDIANTREKNIEKRIRDFESKIDKYRAIETFLDNNRFGVLSKTKGNEIVVVQIKKGFPNEVHFDLFNENHRVGRPTSAILRFHTSSKELGIEEVVTLQPYRGQGYGTVILDFAEYYADLFGYKGISGKLPSNHLNDEPAKREAFYERNGFEIDRSGEQYRIHKVYKSGGL